MSGVPLLMALSLAVGCAGPPARHDVSASPPSTLVCVAGAAGLSLPVVRQRHTLVIDLQGLAGDGECTLQPPGIAGWPERIALRVLPGRTPALEVVADQRLRWVSSEGPAANAVDLTLPHALHSRATREILLRWGAPVALMRVRAAPASPDR